VNSSFDPLFLRNITTFVSYATAKGANVLIDPHNYARYWQKVVGSDVAVTAYQNFWFNLAGIFANNNKVIFGLMNEPNTMQTELWLSDANAAISSIRSAGAKNLIFVPGNAWTGAASWLQNWYGTPNGVVMKGVTDPLNNFAFEVHQYLDSDSSGTHADCVSSTIGSERMSSFTQWAKDNKYRAFLGEFGGGRNPTCYSAIDDMLNHLNANQDVYLGWTWWAGGPWWGDYIYALDPDSNGQDRPQMQYLLPHLKPDTC